MYRLKVNEQEVACTENVVFNKLSENGCFVLCDRAEAQGCVANGAVYSFGEYSDLPVATLEEFDGGKAIQELTNTVDVLTSTILMGGI